ncbi:MAG TPA: ParB/Srx family N-terminal domain-containing protein [Elusimicrobiota bacterium]|nr:ParB/Srx family N-terminal domain-containing protein [Elusimicrobiota bacterium]
MKQPLLLLKPTQFALGLREVARKVAHLKELDHDKRREFIHERPVPVVLSAKKRWHIVDHHHHARACWELGIDELHVEVKADLSHLPEPEFWSAMRESRWVHLHDQFGLGPHAPALLPEDIRGLADDPYRSLAWALRHAGAYEKTDAAFSEFKWADFLRKEIEIEHGDEGFAHALSAARSLARSPKCAHLPGFLK